MRAHFKSPIKKESKLIPSTSILIQPLAGHHSSKLEILIVWRYESDQSLT